MVVQTYTPETFDAFIRLPENADKLFELIGAARVQVSPSNAYASEIGMNIAFFIKLHLRQQHIAGHVTGEAGLYKVGDQRYAPDVAYLSASRQPELDREGANTYPPELAVEIVSDESSTHPASR